MQTIFSKQTSKGLLEVTAEGFQIHFSIEGKTYAASFPNKLKKAAGELTHFIGGTNGAPAIGLTTAEADEFRKAAKAVSSIPVVRTTPLSLTAQRERLVASYRGLIDEQIGSFERAHDHEDANAYNLKASYEPKIKAALEAITEFDIQHPEIIAGIKAKQAEDLRHFEAAN